MLEAACNKNINHVFFLLRYPTFEEKKELAIRIIDTFPLLKNTKVAENAPDYVSCNYLLYY